MLSKTHSPAPTKVSVPAKQKTQGQQRDVTKAHHSGPHTYKQWLQLGSRAFTPIGRCCIRVGDLIIIFLTRKDLSPRESLGVENAGIQAVHMGDVAGVSGMWLWLEGEKCFSC